MSTVSVKTFQDEAVHPNNWGDLPAEVLEAHKSFVDAGRGFHGIGLDTVSGKHYVTKRDQKNADLYHKVWVEQ